jgi:hypothetical protein
MACYLVKHKDSFALTFSTVENLLLQSYSCNKEAQCVVNYSPYRNIFEVNVAACWNNYILATKVMPLPVNRPPCLKNLPSNPALIISYIFIFCHSKLLHCMQFLFLCCELVVIGGDQVCLKRYHLVRISEE